MERVKNSLKQKLTENQGDILANWTINVAVFLAVLCFVFAIFSRFRLLPQINADIFYFLAFTFSILGLSVIKDLLKKVQEEKEELRKAYNELERQMLVIQDSYEFEEDT